ncbi:MAG: Uncharacterised protein [Alphaproteobacteria bacterium UBA4588]|nr:MAG: Uncharacterised protein [Alphaproteobacteria bacterium UBA4588]
MRRPTTDNFFKKGVTNGAFFAFFFITANEDLDGCLGPIEK